MSLTICLDILLNSKITFSRDTPDDLFLDKNKFSILVFILAFGKGLWSGSFFQLKLDDIMQEGTTFK